MTQEHTTDWKTSLVIATPDEVTEQDVEATFERLAHAGMDTVVVSTDANQPQRMLITAAIDGVTSPDRAIAQLIEDVLAAGVDANDVVAANALTYRELEREQALLERCVEEAGI